MELPLTGRTVLVTGASRGIGLGSAHCFAREGCHLRLVARSGDLLAREADAYACPVALTCRPWRSIFLPVLPGQCVWLPSTWTSGVPWYW